MAKITCTSVISNVDANLSPRGKRHSLQVRAAHLPDDQNHTPNRESI